MQGNKVKEFREVVRVNDLAYYNTKELSKRVLEPFKSIVKVFDPLYNKLALTPKYSDWKSLMKSVEKELKKGLPSGLVLSEIAKLRDCLLLYKNAESLFQRCLDQDKQNNKYTSLIYFNEDLNQYEYNKEKLDALILDEATEITTSELEFYVLKYAERLLQDFEFVKINQQSLNLFYNAYPLFQPNTSNGLLEPSLPHIQAFARRLVKNDLENNFVEREKLHSSFH